MPFYSAGDGDLKTAFVSDAWLIDQFVGNTLYGWGFNGQGPLGDNTTTNKSNPVQTIAQGNNWKQATSAIWSNVGNLGAIKSDGTLWMSGYNANGELGDNTTTSKSSPVQTVTFANNWKQVACGLGFATAIKTDGTLWCWGTNGYGQLGDNTVIKKSSPVQTIAGGNNWKQVACGGDKVAAQFAAAIKTDGTLWGWGENTYAQLGDNTSSTKRSSPVQTIAYGTNWKQVSCGQLHTAAIKTDGTLWAWGRNTIGQLGDNTITNRSSPVQTVTYGTNWKQVSCGDFHTSAIKTDGTLWCWGQNNKGQLGDNTLTSRSSPVQTISYGTNWKQVSSGQLITAAIKTDGTLWSWGYNVYGQLGDNTIVDKSSPVQTSIGGTNWKQVSCGYFSFAVTNGDI